MGPLLRTLRQLGALGCAASLLLPVMAGEPQREPDGPTTRAAPTGQPDAMPPRPAVLVVRAARPPAAADEQPQFSVLTPRDSAQHTFATLDDAQRMVEWRHGVPQIPAYRLMDAYWPEGRSRQVRHFVFLDLNNPNAVRQWRALQRAARQERRAGESEARGMVEFERRGERLLSANAQANQDGVAELRAGEYREALVTFALAAELNHGDPVARLHLAQARVALGHDAAAAEALLRALELQPRLALLRLELADYYPDPDEFTDHIDALSERVTARHSATGDEWFLLGFFRFQAGAVEAAHTALLQARARGCRADTLVRLLEITKPAETRGAGPSSTPRG